MKDLQQLRTGKKPKLSEAGITKKFNEAFIAFNKAYIQMPRDYRATYGVALSNELHSFFHFFNKAFSINDNNDEKLKLIMEARNILYLFSNEIYNYSEFDIGVINTKLGTNVFVKTGEILIQVDNWIESIKKQKQ